jgi:hypothetical protein
MSLIERWTPGERRALANLLTEHDARDADVLARKIAEAGFVPPSQLEGAVSPDPELLGFVRAFSRWRTTADLNALAPRARDLLDRLGGSSTDQDDCTCDPPESPTPLGAALCPLHGWDALRRQVVRLSLQHQGAVDRVAELEAELARVRESREAWRLQAMREHDAAEQEQ